MIRKFKIADVVFEMNLDYEETLHWYEPYFYEGEEEAEFSLIANPKRMEYLVKNGLDITVPVAENIVLCTDFNRMLLKYYGSYIHSSALLFDGKAYLFSANSGVGKSTHTKKWLERFGDRALIINDDKPSFRFIDDKCIIYGTPFSGGTNIHKNISAELGALVFIERAEENSLERIPVSKAIALLLEQSPRRANEQIAERQLELFSMILTNYPAYLLKCNMEDSAVDAALGIIND